jgi:hypothetical protein
MQKSMLDPKTTIECPYDPDTREAEAYWCGRNAEIPPPQIIMEDSLSDAWDRGMDDRALIRERNADAN